MTKQEHTDFIIDTVRKETDSVVLFYSGGKDSLALLHMLAAKFKHVTAYFMYFIPGMSHMEPYLQWVKRYPNVTLYQIPHIILNAARNAGVYCEPDPSVKIIKNKDLEERVRKDSGLKWVFSGMKGVDGYMKRMRLKGMEHGAIDKNGTVYPLALWTNKEVLQYIAAKNIIKPIAYGPKISQGITFDYHVFKWLEKNAPGDLQMIYDEFPESVLLIPHYEKNGQHKAVADDNG